AKAGGDQEDAEDVPMVGTHRSGHADGALAGELAPKRLRDVRAGNGIERFSFRLKAVACAAEPITPGEIGCRRFEVFRRIGKVVGDEIAGPVGDANRLEFSILMLAQVLLE